MIVDLDLLLSDKVECHWCGAVKRFTKAPVDMKEDIAAFLREHPNTCDPELETIPKRPSSYALESMAGWKDGANNTALSDCSYHLRGRPGYAEGHARGVKARLTEWERVKSEHPNERTD